MPFTPYKSEFPPELLAVLQHAFDAAWAEVGSELGAINEQRARDMLAKRIVEAAQAGERDPDQLRHHALEAFKE